ncbi:MAG: HAD-IC family P-type ATPase, partial [Clostridia bacterium]|nr:HAD-IC family P-type ATPase [Clostridia bacterium]
MYGVSSVIVIANIAIGIWQEIKAKHKVEKLSMVIDNTCEVIRGGIHSKISTKEIVLDDIFISRAGLQMPVDSVIKSGTIEVDESILTGESVPVKKQAGDYVLAASVIVSGEAIMRADKVGKDCYIENVARVARRVNKPRSNIFSILDKVIKGISIALIFLAGLLLTSLLVTGAESIFLLESNAGAGNASKFQSIVITISAAILGMLPIGMFLLTSTALAASTIKFAKRNTLPQDLYSIEMIAMVDTLLLDKTGTITDGKLEIIEEKIFTNEKIKVDEIFATIVHATKDQNSTANAIREHYLYAKTMEFASCTAFSSARKFSAITLKNGVSYLMGAPDFITRNAPYVEEFVQTNAEAGRRTLALVEFRGDIDDFTPEKGRSIAVISLEDRLRGDVKETLDWFRENDVDIKIISGDNPVTVSQIASKAGVHNAENYLNCKGLSDDELVEKVENTTIFGRVSPEQKQRIVNILQEKGRVVGMVGDGVNDVQALKEADCSISFASANEVARNISRIILMDNNFKTIPSIVQEGRQVISNIQKVSSLYIMKNLFVMFMVLMFTILTFITEVNSYPFDTKRMLLIEFFVIGVPTFCFALQPNKARATDKFLSNIMKASIPSAIGLIAGVLFIFGMLGCFKGDLTSFATYQTASTAAVGLAAAGFACLI